MKIFHKIIITLLFSVFSISFMNAQGAFCSDIEPFCAGDERLTFPNSNYTNSSQITGEAGPDYGCLEEQPYPAWFFLQIEESGNLSFRLSQYENEDGTGAPLDVDFIVWGPFERGEEYCTPESLNSERIIDCSYLPDAVETMTINGAEAQEVYVVLITNFQQLPGFISLQQTNSGGGSTDCTVLELELGDNIAVCDEDEYVLDGYIPDAEIYEWYAFNDASGQYELIPGEESSTLTVTQSGDYKLIVKDLVGSSTDEDEVSVTFYDNPQIGEVSSLSGCSESTEFIDLTETASQLIAPNQNPNDYRAVYYENNEAIENDEPITDVSSFPFQSGAVIYARVEHTESGCLSEIEDFTLENFVFPEYQLPETTIFCVDENNDPVGSVTLGTDMGSDYSYEWRDGNNVIGTTALLTLRTIPETELINLTLRHNPSGCEMEYSTIPVLVSRPAVLSVSITGSDFGEGYTVTAMPEDMIGEEYAAFEYRLDNGGWQGSNVFNQVPPGSHTVTVREMNGCGETTSESFFLVGYPRFFTPNSDGYNDTWNLISNNDISIKRLYVFDRYGKLIRQLDPQANKGWDGTYNGKDLPSDDYWFRVEFVDEKSGEYQVYMSNFTLKR